MSDLNRRTEVRRQNEKKNREKESLEGIIPSDSEDTTKVREDLTLNLREL